MLHLEILDAKRRRMLPELEFLKKEYRFYLAGGTALALQIGHRTSLDFDFYSAYAHRESRGTARPHLFRGCRAGVETEAVPALKGCSLGAG